MGGEDEIVLHYFDIRGLGEVSRLILKIGDVPFKDVRYGLDVTFQKKPPFGDDFLNARDQGELFTTNMNRIPCVEVNGETFGQSGVVERYLSRKAGLLGQNDIEAAKIENVVENVKDIKTKFRTEVKNKPEAEKEEAERKWWTETLPEWIEKLDRSIPSSNKGYAVGSTTSYADIVLWDWLTYAFADKQAVDTVIDEKSPKIKAIVEKVAEIPALQKWLKVRPESIF